MKLCTPRIWSAIATVALSTLASASTYIVDINGGPGVDFTDIPPAIQAATAGDVILVQPGAYSGFTVDKAIAIVGSPGTSAQVIQIGPVAGGGVVSLAAFQFVDLGVTNCAVPVILSEMTRLQVSHPTPQLSVNGCADVRMRSVRTKAGFTAANARVELTSATISGYHAITCLAGSDVHVSLSALKGGNGSTAISPDITPGGGGDGGDGIHVYSSGKVLVSGRSSDLSVGGNYGLGWDCSSDGPPGHGLRVEGGGTGRWSGVTMVGGFYASDCGGGQASPVSGNAVNAIPIDPTLEMSGTSSAGETLTFTLRGTPGDAGQLLMGRQPIVQAVPGSNESLLTNPLRIVNLGALSAAGTAQVPFTIPVTMPKGSLMIVQASTLGSDGITRMTPSVPIIVR